MLRLGVEVLKLRMGVLKVEGEARKWEWKSEIIFCNPI